MNWTGAIAINKAALTAIVAGVVSWLEAFQGVTRLPMPVYRMVARTLYPAEAAVRRLIVIAARGLSVKDAALRRMPQGLVIKGKGAGRASFQLFDARKRFSDAGETQAILGPRIRSVDEASPRALFLARFNAAAADLSSEAATLLITRRLEVLQRALDHLPREARRMARWIKRRAAIRNAAFTSPLRPGPPPGLRKSLAPKGAERFSDKDIHKPPREDIDAVLTECHALAWHALEPDTS